MDSDDLGDMGKYAHFSSEGIEAVAPSSVSLALHVDLQRQTFAARDDFQKVMDLVVDHALILLPGATGAVVELLSADELVYAACSGIARPSLGLRMPVKGSFAGLSMDSNMPLICRDSEEDDRVNREASRKVGLRSMITIPLSVGNEKRGVLKILSDVANAFGTDDLLVAELLAGPVTIGLAAEVRQQQNLRHADLDRRFRATFEQAAVGIAHVAADGQFLSVNDRFCEIVGHSRYALLSGAFQHITHVDDIEVDIANVEALLAGRKDTYAMEKRYIRADGFIQWVRLTVALVRDEQGTPDFFVSVIEDIAAHKAAQQETLTDALTQLPNRRWLRQNLPALLEKARSSDTAIGVAFLDIDGFKGVNDRFGHQVGDECLVAIARCLRETLPQTDIVVRLSGDEFVLVLKDVLEDGQREKMNTLLANIRALGEVQGWPINASVGSVHVPCGVSAETDDVMRLADGMMYTAKRSGGSRHLLTVL